MKNTKLVGLLTLALTLGGLVACGGGKGGSAKSSKHKHEYEVVATDPATKAPTCEEDGVEVKVCKTCGDRQENKKTKLGHSWKAAEDQTGATAPTCTEAGTEKQVCERCQATRDGEVDAIGHNYVEDATDEGNKPATCEEAGVSISKCANCGDTQETPIDPLGHDLQLVGEATTPTDGTAAVNMYKCAHDGCNKAELGFAANQPTEESKGHLVIGEDGGARFWGQPIGNDVVLNEQGDPDESSHDPVFNPAQTGDFFEYKFKLTKEQAAGLSNCVLACDAVAAQWMGNNNMDFWACRAGDTDWTRGMYIEGDHMGEEIDDYRYVLYVDGVRKDFDPTMTAPVARGDSSGYSARTEYILPYKFSLKEGLNTIRLVMAGGYRSTFYKFTFRAIEESGEGGDHTHNIVAGDKATNSALRPISCECGKVAGYELQAADLTEGQKAPSSTDKNTRLGKNVFDDVWNITGIAAGKYDVYLNAQASQGNATNGYWNSATAIAKGDSAGNNGSTEELQKDYKYKVKVDAGEYVNLGNTEDNYAATGLSDSAAAWTTKALAQITIANGATSITVHNMNNGYSIWVFAIRLVKVA